MSVKFYRESPGKFDSITFNRKTINRWTGRSNVMIIIIMITSSFIITSIVINLIYITINNIVIISITSISMLHG